MRVSKQESLNQDQFRVHSIVICNLYSVVVVLRVARRDCEFSGRPFKDESAAVDDVVCVANGWLAWLDQDRR